MKPLISIIVPIYKVEKYLEQCVSSIVSQQYSNIEIILVDDGSPDACSAICEKWDKKDCRIITIHKKNGGLSDARNYGMQIAAGEYIAFVDSDDIISKFFISTLYAAVVSTGASLSACEVESFSDEQGLHFDTVANDKPNIYNAEEALSQLMQGVGFRAVAWNKLYQASILNNEKFEFGKLHEDEFFTYRILDKCQKLAFVVSPLYKYRQREGSIMRLSSDRHLDSLEAGYQRLTFLKERYPSLYQKDKVTFCFGCFCFYLQAVNHSMQDKKYIKKQIITYRKKVHFSPKELLSLDSKQLFYVIGSTPWIVGLFAKIKKV